eukprot:501566_1
MAQKAANAIKNTKFPKDALLHDEWRCFNKRNPTMKDVQKKQIEFLTSFSKTMATLRSICKKQQKNKSLSKEEEKFLKTVVDVEHGSGYTRYNGWYCDLFYGGSPAKHDALAATMFTNPADAATGDRGCHVVEGTSGCDLMFVSIP